MKKTQRIEAFRNIRRNRVSFLSVVIISMLAVTAYLGLSFSAEGMLRSADATYEAECAADLEIRSVAMLTGEDLAAVRAADGVTDAEGIVSVYSRVSDGTETRDVVLRSLTERISLPHLLDGRMPQAGDECAVEKTLAKQMGYKIGDQVQLTGRSALTDRLIKGRTYTVTGLFTSADHLTEMVSFEPMILVTREAFNANLLPEGSCSGILLRAETDAAYRFGSAWKESVDRVAERLEAIDSRWIVTSLPHTASYVATNEDAGILNTVSVTFSMLFVVIAALVIYSTIGRLVEHESRLVGASKAMGLKNSEILVKYLLFGAGGAVVGTAAGILVAYFVFERIVLFFFGTVFLFGEWVMAFQAVPTLIVTAGAALLSFAAVFLACRRLMKSSAVSLMNGQNVTRQAGKKAASRKGALYVRLMFRNMRTDWKRVLVSIVSIAGSCMLLMIGFSLKYAISRVTGRQYGEIQRYPMEIALDASAGAESADAIRAVLKEENIPCAFVYMGEMPYKTGEEQGMITLTVPVRGEDLSDYDCFRDAESGRVLPVPDSGVLVTRKFSQQYHLNTGDSFQIFDSAMNAHDVEIAGVFENYIGIHAVCSSAYAEACFGGALPGNTFLLRSEPQDSDALRRRLAGVEGFISLASSHRQEALFNGISAMLNLVIVLLGVLAVMIACFILLNLVSTYVSQKKNELTIMRINGYTTGETIRYASLECYGITLLGILAGLAAGQAFNSFLIRLIEQLAFTFVKEPLWISFVASAAITAVISGVIHFCAFRKIRTLKLSDIQR